MLLKPCAVSLSCIIYLCGKGVERHNTGFALPLLLAFDLHKHQQRSHSWMWMLPGRQRRWVAAAGFDSPWYPPHVTLARGARFEPHASIDLLHHRWGNVRETLRRENWLILDTSHPGNCEGYIEVKKKSLNHNHDSLLGYISCYLWRVLWKKWSGMNNEGIN